jgi:hypothetical protein
VLGGARSCAICLASVLGDVGAATINVATLSADESDAWRSDASSRSRGCVNSLPELSIRFGQCVARFSVEQAGAIARQCSRNFNRSLL